MSQKRRYISVISRQKWTEFLVRNILSKVDIKRL